jgi:hypothetical protein
MSKQAVRLWEAVLSQLAVLQSAPADFPKQNGALLQIKALLEQIATCDTQQAT